MTVQDVPHPFDTDNEETVRFAVSQYFNDLGFTSSEMSFEQSFSIRLGHTEAHLGVINDSNERHRKIRGRSDLLLMRNGLPLAIVETKSAGHNLTEEDAWQAISYARLLRQVAPFAIVTNGTATKVYDTLADSDRLIDFELLDASESRWNKNGQRLVGLSDDLRHFAAKKLISINSRTFQSFCRKQIETRFIELLGGADQFRPVIPETYETRPALETAFKLWQASSQKCFGLVGESGSGKTNFMCMKAMELVESRYVLFYPAHSLRDGFLEAIRSDMEWEFRQNRSLPYLLDRLEDIAHQGNTEIIIFIDGLDEFPGDFASLGSELNEFVTRASTLLIRLVVSCKSFDWDSVVLRAGRYYTPFGLATYPQAPSIMAPNDERPKGDNIGYHLENFTAAELENVYHKYRTVFSLPGSKLTAQVREQLRYPLLLRLFAETYWGSAAQLPTELSSPDVFSRFIEQKLGLVSQPDIARRLLGSIATKLVEGNRREILVEEFLEADIRPENQKIVNDIFRVGLLIARPSYSGSKVASFAFEKLRSYVYVVHGKHWQDMEPSVVAREIAALMGNQQQTILEAIRFFVEEVDRGESMVLTYLVDAHLAAFLSLTSGRNRHSQYQVSVEHLETNERSRAYWNRLEQYSRSYSRIRLRHFHRIAARLVPYTNGKVGVWASKSGNLVQLRCRNDIYPEPILLLNSEDAGLMFKGDAPQQMLNEIGNPAGLIHLGGMHALLKELPQRIAWNQIIDDVMDLTKEGMLDESHTSLILEERIREMLFHHPNVWIGGISDRRRWYEFMGFQHQDEVYDASVVDLQRLALEQVVEMGRRLDEIDGEDESKRRFWALELEDIYILAYWLGALSKHKDFLERPLMPPDRLFAPIREETLAAPTFEPFLHTILAAYQSMVEANLPTFAENLFLYRHVKKGSPIVCEITRNPHSGLYSDFFEVRFILLPDDFQDMSGTVFWVQGSESVAHYQLNVEAPSGAFTYMSGGRFGHTINNLSIGNRGLTSVPMTLYQTKFPNRLMITSQVYELLGSELAIILDSRNHWHGLDSLTRKTRLLT